MHSHNTVKDYKILYLLMIGVFLVQLTVAGITALQWIGTLPAAPHLHHPATR